MSETRRRRDAQNTLLACRERELGRGHPSGFISRFGRSRRAVYSLDNCGVLEGHKGCVNTINFNASGNLLVSGSDDTTVKLWNVNTRKCLQTLQGHTSNVFAGVFVPHKCDKEIVSAGNDSDIRLFDCIGRVCTVYRHHVKKVLRLTVNPMMPDTFLSCSADGTIRQIDIRVPYANSVHHTFIEGDPTADPENAVMPQAFGGGRIANIPGVSVHSTKTLVLNYRRQRSGSRLHSVPVLFSVDWHPYDGHHFIVGSEDGYVRLFDMRYIHEYSPQSCIRQYKNSTDNGFEVTGCVFNRSGDEIVSTCLYDHIYSYETGSLDYTMKVSIILYSIPKVPPTHCNNLLEPHAVVGGVASYLVDHMSEYAEESAPTRNSNAESPNSTSQPESVNAQLRSNSSSPTEEESDDAQPNALSVLMSLLQEEGYISNLTEESSEEEEATDQPDEPSSSAAPTPTPPIPERASQPRKQVFKGHYSANTIKAVNFYGPDSEFIMSGSDDHRIFIWDKETGELLNILEGHEGIVNCIVSHPWDTMIASSGIDDYVLLWDCKNCPGKEELMHRKRHMKKVVTKNSKAYTRENSPAAICQQQ
ncbi:DDB1- and CUL4-associated factor 8 [Pelomyxa schiedti]|nr:DDB1- and CUL4-associated factor 8 [Pelomyxa schiedti]